MRVSFVILSFAAATVLAQTPPPACTIPCLTNTSNYDGCRGDDNPCLCKSKVFVSRTTACIQAACTGQDLTDALAYAQGVCASVGVTLTSDTSSPTPTSPSGDNSSATTTSETQTDTSAPQNTNAPGGALMQRVHGAAALAVIGSILGLVL